MTMKKSNTGIRYKDRYLNDVMPFMKSKFEYKNVMEIPRIVKIVVNVGIKDAVSDNKVADKVAADIMIITGQKPIITLSKKAIAAFKLREGIPIGCKVTLRSNMMYEFLDRVINIALPRVRDFSGFSATEHFDNGGNFNFGLKEQIIFPEIVFDKIDKIRGMNITIVTTAKTKKETLALLKALDMPFYNT